MSRAIIGTAGHIDHGKTALIRALTGEDTDRLPEEKRRGISIDLGFSHFDVGGRGYGIIDVPGHEDFIRNMVAGATGVDLLLLVVAADEGVMPQTREHVAIASLLRIPRAVVALTKVDLVDADWLQLARDDVESFLSDTPFADAPVVATSAETGEGIDELVEAIEAAGARARGTADDLFRLPVDRSFTVRGTGTVVTGTVWTGSLPADGKVRILPGGLEARVRSLQAHGAGVERVDAGQRAAVALTGVEVEQVGRGDTLVTATGWEPTSMLTCRLRVLPGAEWSIEPRQRVRVHLATAEVMARVALLEGRPLAPGDEGWAQLRLETPLVARAGDPFVVRSYSPVFTIGGGTVVEPLPPKRSRLPDGAASRLATLLAGTEADVVEARLRGAGPAGARSTRLPLETGLPPARVEAALREIGGVAAGDRVFHPDALGEVRACLIAAVERGHAERPLLRGLEAEEVRRAAPPAAAPALVARALDGLVAEAVLVMKDGRVARSGFEPRMTADQQRTADQILAAVRAEAPNPLRLEDLAERVGRGAELPDLLALLEADGRVAAVAHDLFMDPEALAAMIVEIRQRFGGRSGLGPVEFREVIDVPRRSLIPILEHLDIVGVTVRGADGRSVPERR